MPVAARCCPSLRSMPVQRWAMTRRLSICAPGISTQHLAATRGTSHRSLTRSHASAPGGPSRVCILGGGFGGLYAAVKLESLMWPKGSKPQITMVDRSDRFVFKPLLYELLNGTADAEEVAPSFEQLLAPYTIRFLQGNVSSVKLGGEAEESGVVSLADGREVEYDYLVVALGSGADPRGVPGVKELAVPFNNFDDAQKVNQRLAELEQSRSGGKVLVVGAGYAGVELATVVAERLKGAAEVGIVAAGSEILEASTPGQREISRSALEQLGVKTLTGTRVLELKPWAEKEGTAGSCIAMLRTETETAAVTTEEEVDLLLWTAGAAPATRSSSFPFPTNSYGALLAEPTLQVSGCPRVYALGDVATTSDPSGQPLPPTAQVAFQQADYAAWNVWAAINGRSQLPFRYQHLGSAMALGQLNAAVTLPFGLPPPLKQALEEGPLSSVLRLAGVRLGGEGSEDVVTLFGPVAAAARRAVYLYRQPTNEQRIKVASSWLQQAATAASSIAQGMLPAGGSSAPKN